MAYTFERNNFKNYLHENCHRNWFGKQSGNIRYRTENGNEHDAAYSNEYTVLIKRPFGWTGFLI